MPDERFFQIGEPLTFSAALSLAAARMETAPEKMLLHRVSSLREGARDGIVYAETTSAAAQMNDSEFGLCLATEEVAAAYAGDGAVAICDNPRVGFARIAARLHKERLIDDQAGMHPSAQVGEGTQIHPSAVIGENVRIGDNVIIGPGVVIGPGVEIGAQSLVEAGAVTVCSLIGACVKIKSGARLGQSGFGFVETPTGPMSVPQLGRLVIGDDVEIGANTTVDRGALGDTVIGDGTKIDNLVHIGHNVRIGRHCVIAAQVGFAGSTVLGDGVMVGGQAGLAGHLEIGDTVQIAGKAGVMSNIPAGEKWGGCPARPMRRWLKETAMIAKLTKKKK